VDDDKASLKNLEHGLKKEGFGVTGTVSIPSALKLLEQWHFDIVLTGPGLDNGDGMEVLEKARRVNPDAEVILTASDATISSAVEAMKMGACEFIAKPFELVEIRDAVTRAVDRVWAKKETLGLRERLKRYEGMVKIITRNSAMHGLLETAGQIAPTDCNVLITGESGTGKELLARYIHFSSKRAEGPFFAINCGALNEELLTNELFGHEKGAFTGADTLKKGLIEAASGGTLFLDEITEMSPAMQVKLLRVLQEKELLRVGGTTPVKVDVRIIAATNRDIQEAIADRQFRKDLFYRLNVVSINMPPLSERRDDIHLLCQHFLAKFSAVMKKEVKEISSSVMGVLMNYDFPGNVRELENIIERGVALTNGPVIELAHLPEDLKELEIRTFRKKDGRLPSLAEQEIAYIKWVIRETGGNKTLAAQVLGIDRVSLWRKMKKFGHEEG